MLIILLNVQEFATQLFGSDKEDLTPVQMMLRAVITFLIALLIIRLAGIRSFGSKSAFDIVLSITVGAVLSRCITGHYSYFACVGAALSLALMHRLFAMMAYSSKQMANIIKGQPHVLLKNDRIHWKNMKRHNITMDDLIQTVHKKGFMDLNEIEEAFFETDGKISLIPKSKRILPT